MARTAQDIRKEFIDFFRSKDHTFVRSAPVLPSDDPTLLFTNAGMNQFKPIFLNRTESEYKRAVNSQKCIRVSGKHNDLEEVGRDGHHHTFFEMLGNWSFGDYYKKEAIAWHWELLTKVWKLDKQRLWISVYNTDDESARIWTEDVGVPAERVLRFGNKENFWEMGETGPCGPCTEVHYYIGDDLKKQRPEGVNVDDSYREICNLVFIEYNRSSDGDLNPLPNKHVDTGMGLERVVSVVNGYKSNYDSDLFQPIIEKIISLTDKNYDYKDGTPHRVIADHIRMVSFSLADGILPSNDGRGYVVRRILRRASRFARELGVTEPMLYRLVEALENCMAEHYPEIKDKRDHIEKIIKAEEQSFLRTLDRGIEEYNKIVSGLDSGAIIPGESAFKLYDTFGFPIDLTQMMARESGISVDFQGFEVSMEKQKDRGREGSRFAQEESVEWIEISKGSHSAFVGYEHDSCESFVRLYRTTLMGDVEIVLDKTPFYAESGGQVGDAGLISGDSFEFTVLDTYMDTDRIVHKGKILSGEVDGNIKLLSSIDVERRNKIRLNHTATHLLHRALKNTLGKHVQQAGSLVSDNRLRFDLTHYEPISMKQIRLIESEVNSIIRDNVVLDTNEMEFDQAKESGAEALFGEKYGDSVRVVDIDGFSKELCGGTHVSSTGDIGTFKIVSESSLASGVRRIEALTGEDAIDRFSNFEESISSIKKMFSCSDEDIVPHLKTLIGDKKNLQKKIKQLSSQRSSSDIAELIDEVVEYGKIKILIKLLDGDHNLKSLADQFRDLVKNKGIAVFGLVDDNKPSIVSAVTKDITSVISASEIVKSIGKFINGGGGGTDTLATAGGKKPDGISEALEDALKLIKEAIDNG